MVCINQGVIFKNQSLVLRLSAQTDNFVRANYRFDKPESEECSKGEGAEASELWRELPTSISTATAECAAVLR